MNSVKTLDEFFEVLNNYEIETYSKFNIWTNTKGFLDEKRKIAHYMRLCWKGGLPYYGLGSRVYTCHNGKDKNICKKIKSAERKLNMAQSDDVFHHSYNLTQVTKKLDCPVTFTVTRACALPQFKLDSPTRSRKDVVARKIKTSLEMGEDVGEEECYWFTLPSVDDHRNHVQGEISAVVEPVDPVVRSKIKEFVHDGQRNPFVVSELLEVFVKTDLKQTDKNRRRFYPDIPTIKGLIKVSKRIVRYSKIEMDNTKKLLETYDKSDFYFRPFTKDGENVKAADGRMKSKSILNRHLLFVYQNSNMRRLYHRYGGEAVLLDATYRVCKHAIPLYFLAVKTNINFQVVAIIISQYKTAASISEGLKIIKTWNPDVKPKSAMTDLAAEEICALENVFPGINVFICSFHRERAWNSWLSKRRKNSPMSKTKAFAYLSKVANAPSEEKLQEALQELKSSSLYNSSLLKIYFEGTWEMEIHRWCSAFKPNSMLLNTNNGVERLNEELNYSFLDEYKDCNLSKIIEVLIESFLPQRYNTYLEGNLRMSAKCTEYSDELPSYLHERPKWFIKHVQDELEKIHFDNDTSSIEMIDEASFIVVTHDGLKYLVKFDEDMKTCSCDCVNYIRTRLLCRHCLIVGEIYEQYHISRISKWLLSNPLFCCDKELVDNFEVVDVDQVDSNQGCDDPDPGNSNQGCNDPDPGDSNQGYNDPDPGGSNDSYDDHIAVPQENPEKTQESLVCEELEKTQSKRRKLINEFNSHMRNLGSMLQMTPEKELLELNKSLLNVARKMRTKVRGVGPVFNQQKIKSEKVDQLA